MLNDNNFLNHDNRNLSEVFKELQAMQYGNVSYIDPDEPEQDKRKNNNKHTITLSFKRDKNSNSTYQSTDLKLSHIITGCSILIVAMAVLFPKNTSFKESYAKPEEPENISEYEINRHRLNIQNIISENADMDRVKEQVVEERDVEFETNYNNNASLPKGEEVVTQEGIIGKDKVTAIKTYENGEFVEEIILARETLDKPTPKEIDLGTSEILAKLNVHIGDTLYLVNTNKLKKSPEDSSEDVAQIKASLDVKLLELVNEDWFKVSFETVEGYIKSSALTSPTVTPNIVEKNRIQKIMLKVNINMELNKPSGLTLNDYKKVFTGLSNDTKKVFENNYSAFYNAEKKYNINGIFLASIAIHESSWGSSQIAADKNNLFGYGSYDSTPYESSLSFTDYSEGIETVAKSLVKYYLNPAGTKIYDGETAAAWYYNGPTLEGVNTRYASDKEWHKKVYSYMELLYNRL